MTLRTTDAILLSNDETHPSSSFTLKISTDGILNPRTPSPKCLSVAKVFVLRQVKTFDESF